jgi:serine/threonine protein kinase/tetratricopeptide (TPR) repeat protein
MKPERWQRIKQVWEAASERERQERAAFLSEACQEDDTLRRAVESLLAADEEAGTFLETPVFAAAAEMIAAEPGASLIGQRIGAYQIISELGRGGMGAVYLAERADAQFRKQVAIKLVKRGLDSQEILRRFHYERQILASLEHPHIARLLDGGTTADGLPYFVMEHIAGTPIDQYCDRHQLNTSERLKLFRDVCAAVQFAHQNLVVHRDLKPSNILVTEAGQVKLLDFGIAKLLHPDLLSQTLESTALGARPMTPEYASPEQVRGAPITTASDVYSLGVVLYELLTGHRPYRFTAHSLEEMARVICEQEPEKPSTVISRTAETLGADDTERTALTPEMVSRTREGQPEKLRRRLAGDLDNIVLKALRKEPARRYASVEQLAEDLRRHLEGRPVIARSDTLGYRAGKFIQRHKAGVAAVLLIVVTLAGGMVATAWQARVARAERARAEQRFNDVRKLANSFMFEFHDAIQNLPGTVPARQLVVKKALEYLDSLARESSHDPALQRELATAYHKLGEIQGSLIDFGNSGNSADALASYRKALAMREALSAANPEDAQARNDLAGSYLRLGQLLAESGDASGALELCRKGVTIREAAVAADPASAQARFDLASSYRSLFAMQAFNGHYLSGVESLRKGLEIFAALLAAEPANARVRRQLIISHMQFGDQMWLLGNPAKAWEHYRRGQQINEEWVNQEPANWEVRRLSLIGPNYLNDMRLRYGNPSEVLEDLRQSVALFEEMVAQNPGDTRSPRDLAILYQRMADACAASGDTARAHEYYRKLVAILESLAATDPQSTRFHRDLGESYTRLGKLLMVRNNAVQALETARKAQRLFDGLLEKDPNHVEIRRNGAFAFLLLAQTLSRTGQAAEARRYLTRALEMQKAQADKPEAVGDRIDDYPWSLLTCEPAELRDPAAALPYAQLAAERTRENDPNILKTLALAYHLTRDPARAMDAAQKALALLPPRAGGKGDSLLRRELEAQMAKSQAAPRNQPAR